MLSTMAAAGACPGAGAAGPSDAPASAASASDPTCAGPDVPDGQVLDMGQQLVWHRKVWQKKRNHRARALMLAEVLGHKVIVTMQNPLWWMRRDPARREREYRDKKWGDFLKNTCATSFKTYDDFEAWHDTVVSARAPAAPPRRSL